MTYRKFLFRRSNAKRTPERRIVEQRIVAEAARAALFVEHQSFDRALECLDHFATPLAFGDRIENPSITSRLSKSLRILRLPSANAVTIIS